MIIKRIAFAALALIGSMAAGAGIAQSPGLLDLPAHGLRVEGIPPDFLGNWGVDEQCRASATDEASDFIAFSVQPTRFGDYGLHCDVEGLRLLSPEEVVIRGQCSEEGGLADGDDGVRRVTMKLLSHTRLWLRVEAEGPDPASGDPLFVHEVNFPRCGS